MYRAPTLAFAAAVTLLTAGCASMWDAVTSRRFRDDPVRTVRNVIVPEDPMLVLRSDSRTGDDRAKAMHRLKEPVRNGGTQDDQDQVIEILTRHATSDPSPVLRFAAIEALGRFEDPRAVGVLTAAFQRADGLSEAERAPPRPAERPQVLPIGASAGRPPTRTGLEPHPLKAPAGFSPDTVAALRCRCLESLGATHQADAAKFLAVVAGAAGADTQVPGGDDPEVRQAAVRGLSNCRQPEAVAALAEVLKQQAGKDVVLARQSHQGLVKLTGKRLPPDPEKWGEVVQAGVTLAPEPTWADNLIQSAAFWEKR